MANSLKKSTNGAIASALLMLLALLWLTISTPFIYSSQQIAAAKELHQDGKKDQGSYPLNNTTEERSENGPNTSFEYVHETQQAPHYGQPLVQYEKCHAPNLYIAFHPDLHCPPPDQGI